MPESRNRTRKRILRDDTTAKKATEFASHEQLTPHLLPRRQLLFGELRMAHLPLESRRYLARRLADQRVDLRRRLLLLAGGGVPSHGGRACAKGGGR